MIKRTISASVRLILPISPDLYKLLKRAADLQGRSITDFVISAAQREAEHLLGEAETRRLLSKPEQPSQEHCGHRSRT